MYRGTIALSALALTALAAPTPSGAGPLELSEVEVIVEYQATLGVATVLASAETDEQLEQVEIRAPSGATVLRLQSRAGAAFALSSFDLETEELDPASLSALCAQGIYEVRGRTTCGRPARGSAVLSHLLPAVPTLLYPAGGETTVPSTNLTLSWVPDPNVAGYEVVLEQGESDDMIVRLPAHKSSLQVPDGVLAPGQPTYLEVIAVGRNGNRTVVEVQFTTL